MYDELKAFPGTPQIESIKKVNEGMDLRDYFAAKAMQALLPKLPTEEHNAAIFLRTLPSVCYGVADSFMKER